MGRERLPVVPPNLDLIAFNKKSRCDNNGVKASLTYRGTSMCIDYTLRLDNGGSSGTGYSIILSPCSSENHSTSGFVWHSHHLAILWTVCPTFTLSLHSFSLCYELVGKVIAFSGELVKTSGEINQIKYLRYFGHFVNTT